MGWAIILPHAALVELSGGCLSVRHRGALTRYRLKGARRLALGPLTQEGRRLEVWP